MLAWQESAPRREPCVCRRGVACGEYSLGRKGGRSGALDPAFGVGLHGGDTEARARCDDEKQHVGCRVSSQSSVLGPHVKGIIWGTDYGGAEMPS